MSKKVKINEGHSLEILDRVHVASCMVHDHLVEHPAMSHKKFKKVKKKVDKALQNLVDAYHEAGQFI